MTPLLRDYTKGKTVKALISVSDKTDIIPFARGLVELGYGIISTGGTYEHLQQHGITVERISDFTGFDEILDGRVKTLHPYIYASILYQRDNSSHKQTLQQLSLPDIGVVCVNLYPFEQQIDKCDVNELANELIEYIDIGGVTLLRAAAKNYQDCLVVCDSKDYDSVLQYLHQEPPESQRDRAFRASLMHKSFCHTAHYDMSIANYYMKAQQ